jgi:two-component system, chemotaxis family, chemotaxis protein CheY
MAGTLMIIDDSSTMRKIIKRTVRMSGFSFSNTLEAENGLEGFEKLSKEAVDVVLCDVNMPEMNGLEMVKKVREELPAHKSTKIIMVTTESSQEFISNAMAAGADGYISKPFTPEKFQQKLGPIIG